MKLIEIRFPDLTEFEKKENGSLFRVLSQLDNAEEKNDTIVAGNENLCPRTIFKKSQINNPQISLVLDGDISKSWQAGDLRFGFNLTDEKEAMTAKRIENYEFLKDKTGDYTKLELESKKYYILTIEQFLKRFDGKLKNLNHAGVNFGPAFFNGSDYSLLKKLIAERCNLYKYPTGEEWPFIIPATDNEFLDDISDETVKRNPKFEIVYYENQLKPVIQIDIETNLTKGEVLELLPSPYGVSFDNLKEMFRTVFILTDWPGVIFRLDLRFKSAGKDFEYWMVKEGGRIS